MENNKAIEALNSLITINNDRIEGYKTASDVSEERDLQTLFTKFISTSQKCKQELVKEVQSMGGKIAEGTKTTGKFFRAWIDVKAAITGKDRKAILKSCEKGEDKAQDTYEEVIENEFEHLTTDQKNMVLAHKSILKGDRDHVKSMHEALVDA